ncbi:ZN469 protein, partial [Amia calva]|nr:ZN469 protein [Amia calva]
MTGDTQHVYAIKESETNSKQQDEETLFDQFSDKDSGDFKNSLPKNSNTNPQSKAVNGAEYCLKDKESYSQREAVIRPQQAGKIDFKSLQNRPKFSSDRTWPSSKGSPQSPSGKSRGRDKNKKAGKGERNPQQLYRLSMTNSRSNPTIGIAYPQQKVTPPKKLETNRGPIIGSYRFHVPSIPEREAELQQEDLNYSRCFQEASSNLTSTNYTSHASGATGAAAHQQQTSQQPPAVPRENSSTQSGHLHYPEFQGNGTSSWHSPEKTFNGANYGVSSQKQSLFTEGNKSNTSFGPMPFQYGFPSLQDSATDSFSNDQNSHSQDYIDISLANNQVTHSTFPFHSSGDGQEEKLSNGQFDSTQPDGRAYPQASHLTQYLQSSQGAQSSLPCFKGRADLSKDVDGPISSSHSVEQKQNSFPESQTVFTQEEISLHNSGTASVHKRSPPPKDSASNQRILTQGNSLTRNIAQGSTSQMHFQGKAYGSSPVNTIHTGTVPFDKSIPSTIKNHVRITQAWEGPNKTFPPPDQNAAPYSTPSEKQYQFQCQPAVEQRQHTLKNGRYAWQQIHLTSAMPNQNRIELSRQLSNQSFPITSSEWQDSNKPHKHAPLNSPSGFHGKRQSEGFTNTRQENIKQNCSTSAFPFENGVNSSTQACDSRNKKPFCGLNQPLTSASSRNNNHTPLQVPPVGLISSSPYESPLPSPIQNPASSSTCSTLSPVSTSPVNMSSEDSQLPMAGPPPPFYHQHCHLKEGKSLQSSDQLNSSLHHLHPDVSRNFSLPPERTKDDMFNFLHDTKFSKPNSDSGKGCMNSFGVDHPPPPPYSAHQLLANSLAAANLDQLDVLLTCKQCDQNFNNLSSFLEHKQYCGQHTMTQSDFKDTAKVEESRKFQMDLTKTAPSIPTFPLSRCPSDLHLSLLGLNKNGELLSDGDPKDDPLKLNLFNGMTALPVSLTSSDLEIDDAKLDSLITEALNGLGYQSDNAEIDSSFIDAFTDDDLSTAKITGSGQSTKMKDSALFESKSKHVASAEERSQLHLYDFDRDTLSTENKNLEIETEKRPKDLKEGEKDNTKEVSHKKTRGHSFFEKSSEHNDRLKLGRKPISDGITESGKEPGVLVSKKVSDGSGLKSYQESSSLTRPAPPDVSTRSTVTQRFGVKESKKRKSGGGTWSKELIHKIVQQKNKLHKLHVKGTKNLQFSLVMERLVPAPQNSKFGEYDYVSDSDEESEPLKIANRGRLAPGLGGRSKYSYGKEYKGRGRGEKEKPWKYNSKEGFESKIIEPLSPPPLKETSSRRVRRRSSRSSTSSDLSTPASLSSESVNSPKNNDRTDSDNERGLSEKRKGSVDINLSDSFEHETYERSPPEVPKEPSAAVPSHINKSLPRYSSKGSVVNETSECCVSATDNSDRTEETSNVTNVNTAITTENTSFKETLTEFQTTESTRKSSCISETVLDANSDIADFNKNVTDDALATDKSGFEINNRRLHSTSVVLLPGEGPSIVPFERISESVFHDKESLNHFDCDVFHKPAPLAITSADDVCLCPADLHGGAVPKDTSKQGPITYPIEPDQSLMKSPLTFDTSSMFGDLAVPSFDNSLYVDVPMNKEGFHSFTSNNDKRELFEPPFPQYLGQKDWSLMDDVNPMLPDDIAQFQGLSEKALNKKFNSSHMPLALPEKLTDYNTNFISNISEDELEIKRIVTELESQLQTTKLTGATSLASEISKQLNSNKFSPLHLDHEAESAQNMSMHDTGRTAELAVTSVTTDPSLEEHYEDPDQSWSSAFQFGSLEGQQCLHTPVHAEPNSPEHFYNKEGTETLQSNVGKEAEQTENDEARATSAIKGPLTDKSEEMLENQMYAENLMKSLEVISDSIFNKETVKQREGKVEQNTTETKSIPDLNEVRSESTVAKKSSTQGTILCDICSACFRTVPGLKRHKAVKHGAKKEKNIPSMEKNWESTMICAKQRSQEAVMRENASVSTSSLPRSGDSHVQSYSLEREQNDSSMLVINHEVGGVSEKNKQKALESKGKQKVLTPMGKTKRADKAQKGKKVDNNRSYFEPTVGMAEHFSEDVLSMLKTDILQAITPNFPVKARGLDRTDTLLTQPEEQTRPNVSGSPKVKEDAIFAFKQTDSVDKPELVAVCPEQTELCESAQMVGQNEPESPIEKGLELMEFADILEDSVKLKCSETSCPTDWGDPPTYPYKKPSASIAESQADLQALLDDESTFSQLFPRDEQMIRKKCTRVYGKRNKKTNLPPDLSLQQTPAFLAKSVDNKELSESHESPAFVSKLRDQCEYETISIDDAIMLDMCHKSTLKNDSLSTFDNIIHPAEADTGLQTEDPIDKGGVGVREFLCQEDETIHNTSAQWNHSKDLLTDIVAKSVLSLDTSTACKTEDTDTPCHQQLSDASDSQASVTDSHDNTSHFHNIDIQNLNTKFQLPDIKFFESGKDNVNADITDSDIAGSQSMKPSKRPLERKTRKRSEAGIKPKDKQYKCKACFTWFLTIGELNFHKLSHNPSPPPTCYMCVQRKFSSREQLRDHLKEKHAKNKAGIWTCGMCLKEISDVWMYNEHLREHATQFARKGQAQKSVLGLPGCFMQETAVKNFLSSIMQRRPSRSVKSDGSKTPAKEGKAAKENLEQDPKAKDASETAVKNKLNSGGGGKHTTQVTQTQSEDMPKVEASQKSVVMHPNCKDPSRDCHHCGKQFPKPFKLQRHLVVHSLQKIFLCHKCPIFYKELQELKTHLKDEHSVIEEPEVKHTTLYACELCADVMHVIKKSFICSTCNYTFSKKEQYDRHMEKHLAGGSKTFKFRGVMRPCKSPKDEEFELQTSFKKEYMPPNKKRKISSDSLTENSSDSGIASMASLQFNSHGEVHLSKQTQPVTSDFFTETVDNPHSSLEDVSVKSEDFAEDVSELVVVMEPSPFVTESESPCPSPAGPKTNTVDSSASPELPLAEEVSTVCDGTAVKSAETCDIQIDDDYCDQQSKQCDSVLAVNDRGARGDEFSSSDSQTQSESISQMREELQSLEASKEEMDSSVPTKTVSETPDQKHQSDANSKAASSSEFQTCGQTSSRSSENAKHSTDYTKVVVDDVKLSTGSQGLAEPVTSYSKPSTLNVGKSEEKDLLCLKLQKKRKDFKISQSSKVSSSTRENFDSEMRKKKIRVQSPAKTESTGSYKKADITNDYPVLASVRDDMASNKIHLKPKTGGINMQPKRNSFESYPPKKADFRHLNGDFKGKKGIPGRPLHSSASKGSLPSVNSSMNKYRPVSGARSVESHNYRTAESQNHLLSQLFGQKLTSFKIPLRKDNSE